MSECLSVADMAALADDRATPDQRKTWLRHIAGCEECLEEYLFLMQLKTKDAGTSARETPKDPTDGSFGPAASMSEVLTSLAAASAAIIAPFAWHDHGTPDYKVASGHDHGHPIDPDLSAGPGQSHGHEINLPGDERTGADYGSNHQNHSAMNDATPHAAPTHFGPDASNQTSVDVNQHYSDTCAIRSQQLILRDFGVNVTQEDLIREAHDSGWYDHGTKLEDVGKLLETHGVTVARFTDANEYTLFHELAQGHEVIVAVNSNQLWQQDWLESARYSLFGGNADHALIVAGIDTTDPHHPSVILKDPGTGQIAKEYPMSQFLDAWKGSHNYMVTTQQPAPFYLPQMAHFDYAAGHVAEIGGQPYHDFVDHYTATAGHAATTDPHSHDLPGYPDNIHHHQPDAGHHADGHTQHDPEMPHDPGGHHDPGSHDPNTYDPNSHDPGYQDPGPHHQ